MTLAYVTRTFRYLYLITHIAGIISTYIPLTEVEEGDLELWNLTFYYFSHFINSLLDFLQLKRLPTAFYAT